MLISTSNGRVYRSTDFATAETVSGSPNDPVITQGFGRCRVAISPDDSQSAFALLATTGSQFGGVFHSARRRRHLGRDLACMVWRAMTSVPPTTKRGMTWPLGVQKGNPEMAFVGGQALWKCGPSYQAEQAASMGGGASNPFYVHADVHEIIFTPGGTMFIAGDGGIFRSDNGGVTYTACNRGLAIDPVLRHCLRPNRVR